MSPHVRSGPDTATQPLPVITLEASGDESRPPATRVERRMLMLGVAAALGLTALVLVVLHWQLILTALLALLLAGFLVLIAACVLVRIATGGRLGSALLGSIVTALLLRRRR